MSPRATMPRAARPIERKANRVPSGQVDCETESQYHPPMAKSPLKIPLTQLGRGQRATVECSALDALPSEHRCLLAAMGLGEKCEVRVCRAGTPCIIQIDQTRLGLPRDIAERIMVTPLEPNGS